MSTRGSSTSWEAADPTTDPPIDAMMNLHMETTTTTDVSTDIDEGLANPSALKRVVAHPDISVMLKFRMEEVENVRHETEMGLANAGRADMKALLALTARRADAVDQLRINTFRGFKESEWLIEDIRCKMDHCKRMIEIRDMWGNSAEQPIVSPDDATKAARVVAWKSIYPSIGHGVHPVQWPE